jgi:hypothetical protein
MHESVNLLLRSNGKDVKILPLSTSFYVEPTARQNFNVVSTSGRILTSFPNLPALQYQIPVPEPEPVASILLVITPYYLEKKQWKIQSNEKIHSDFRKLGINI